MEQENQGTQPEQVQAQPAESQKADISNDAKNLGMLCHLLGLFTSFVGPLVIWLIKKDTMPYVDYHGKESLNFQITLAIAYFVAGLSFLCAIGVVLVPVLGLLHLIFCIIASIAASKGEYYKYPFCMRLVK
ncbi:MAG: DUF4870 domain-containing protein [Sedimentisphaerales bacterium]|nr:DUF4870 domain-containing protein [Sedimentisphaerales bacterium]